MRRAVAASLLAATACAILECTPAPRSKSQAAASERVPPAATPLSQERISALQASPAPPTAEAPSSRKGALVATSPPRCTAADWRARQLPPLLHPGKKPNAEWPDKAGASELLFDPECTDSPGGPVLQSTNPAVVDGVEIFLVDVAPAGKSRRGWIGGQCTFKLRAADGPGSAVSLGPDEIPPFTTVTAVQRSGSAVWLGVSFNGYAAEFPKGGNRIIAVDLCAGRIVWKSKDSMANGGLLLLDDYLVSPYGFTSERRYVFVLDAHSGGVIQKLPVVENVCPSKSWAPHWHPGERCDAPGQVVGAATAPRIEGGIFFVDTNTGSSGFELASTGANKAPR